jgi:hypothetical protein
MMRAAQLATIIAFSLAFGDIGTTAGLGWYLMAPRGRTTEEMSLAVFARDPLNTWRNIRAFDSFAECEHGRDVVVVNAKERAEQIRLSPTPDIPGKTSWRVTLEDAESLHSLYYFSLCIASDDPRLAR